MNNIQHFRLEMVEPHVPAVSGAPDFQLGNAFPCLLHYFVDSFVIQKKRRTSEINNCGTHKKFYGGRFMFILYSKYKSTMRARKTWEIDTLSSHRCHGGLASCIDRPAGFHCCNRVGSESES
jgi:hypothetical protein